MDPELQMLVDARSAIAQGADPKAVDARLSEMTEGKHASVEALAAHLRNGDAGMSTSDRFRMEAQGATLGWAPQIAGGMDALKAFMKELVRDPLGHGGVPNAAAAYTAGRDESRTRVAQLRNDHPGEAMAYEGVGGLLPAVVGGEALSAVKGAPLAARALAGGAMGGVQGGLLGMGESDPNASLADRAASAAPLAAASAVGGAVAEPFLRALPRMAGNAGARAAKALEESTGLSGDMNGAIDTADKAVQDVRDKMYAPLEQQFKSVNDPNLLSVLRSPDLKAQTAAVAADVANGKRPPSLEEVQAIRSRLGALLKTAKQNGGATSVSTGKGTATVTVKQIGDMLDNVKNAAEGAIPGYKEANAAYHVVSTAREALDDGRAFIKSGAKSAADIQRELAALPAEAQATFKQGMVYEAMRKLTQRNEGSVKVIRSMLDAGPEMRAKLASMFPDDEAFQKFTSVLKQETDAQTVLKWAKRLGAGAVAYAGLHKASGMTHD